MKPAIGTIERDALERVVNYLWDDERHDFDAQGSPMNHIAVDLALLVVAADLRNRMAEAQDILATAKNLRADGRPTMRRETK